MSSPNSHRLQNLGPRRTKWLMLKILMLSEQHGIKVYSHRELERSLEIQSHVIQRRRSRFRVSQSAQIATVLSQGTHSFNNF